MNLYLDFKEIENDLSDDEKQDSIFEITKNSDDKLFDSAIQLSNNSERNSQETVKLNIQQSPERGIRWNKSQASNNNQTRISFGYNNSLQKLKPQKLVFNSGTNSVRSSVQQESHVFDTAQFPQYKKFAQRINEPYLRNSIEELSVEQENSMNQSKDASLKQKTRQSLGKKLNLTVATDEGIEEVEFDDDYIPQRVATQDDQYEFFIVQLATELEKQKKTIDYLSQALEVSKKQTQKSHKLSMELCITLEQTQDKMMELMKENQILKKKQLLMTQGDSERQVSTFLTADSEYQSQNKENKSNRSNRIPKK